VLADHCAVTATLLAVEFRPFEHLRDEPARRAAGARRSCPGTPERESGPGPHARRRSPSGAPTRSCPQPSHTASERAALSSLRSLWSSLNTKDRGS
jgi:hypothetical protein